MASEPDRVAPRVVSAKGGRPPFPTETMVRIRVLKRLHNLSDEQTEFQLLDRLSFQRFYGLTMAANIPERTTVWNFENRIGASGAAARFWGLNAQLLNQGYLTRVGKVAQVGGKLIRTIGQARAYFGMTMMALCYNIKQLGYLRTAGIEAF